MEFVLTGIICGIISGTGMGGGTVLIFILTHILALEYKVAQASNLIYFIPTSIAAIIVNILNKNIDINLAIKVSVFGIIGAIIGSNISIYFNTEVLKKFFGFFLLVIAIREIWIIFKNFMNKKNKKRDTRNI